MKKRGDEQKQQRTADNEEKKEVVVAFHVVQNVLILRVLNPRHCYARMDGKWMCLLKTRNLNVSKYGLRYCWIQIIAFSFFPKAILFGAFSVFSELQQK